MLDQTKDKLEIELTSKCVIQCPACSRTVDADGKSIWDAGHLDKELLFDIADNLAWKSKNNFTLDHFAERLKMYNDEKFEYKMYKVKLK